MLGTKTAVLFCFDIWFFSITIEQPDFSSLRNQLPLAGAVISGKALWAVQHWDRKWLLLKRRKMRLRALYERCLQCQALSGEREQELQAKLLLALDETHSELGVDDVEAKYHLHFPADEVQINQGQFKRPKRRSRYSVCRQAGLGSVSKCFGLTAEQFGENLKDKVAVFRLYSHAWQSSSLSRPKQRDIRSGTVFDQIICFIFDRGTSSRIFFFFLPRLQRSFQYPQIQSSPIQNLY